MKNKYVKKPVVVEAVKWTGLNEKEIMEFCLGKAFFGQVSDAQQTEIRMSIETLEGVMTAKIGDFIIKGIKGEFYPCKPDIFEQSYDLVPEKENAGYSETHPELPPATKTLHNTTSNGARKNVKDIQFWGDGDTFQLISKASSENEGWFKSTKAMEVEGVGCVVQVTTQQRNPDNSYSLDDAVTFVPNCKIERKLNENGEVISRKLVDIKKPTQK